MSRWDMRPKLSRRLFLALAGGAMVGPRVCWAAPDAPSLLDHILLGCSDLNNGISFVEKHLGVRAALGGVHPGAGTKNALLSLGERRYLEIIAPDPAQQDANDPRIPTLRKLSEPRLVGWAAHPGDLDQFAAHLRNAGIAFEGPTPGSRKRLDGRVLHWRTLNLKENPNSLLPFFIEWSADSLHPSADAPKGLRLVRLGVLTPDPEGLAKFANLLSMDISVSRGDGPMLQATFSGPRGELTITS
jgi:hypothetical protein